MSGRRFTVLVIGGYGVFGSRLCRRLAAMPGIAVIVAGRSLAKAEAQAQRLRSEFPAAQASALEVDILGDLPGILRASRARLVVHAAGPFQGQDYRVARACIADGLDYLDLSDGRDFVTGITVLDATARAAGVLVVSGASTVPGLSGAVVAKLSEGLAGLESIEIGITPGNRTARGPGVVEAILSYTGQPIPRWTQGASRVVHGWQDLHRHALRLPGHAPVGPRWYSACDVPDLALLPARYVGLRSLAFHAGLELRVLHFGLWLLSWPVRWRFLPHLKPLAPLAWRIARLLMPFGTDRGGMFVTVTGRESGGRRLRRRWTLIAENGDGPFVPCLPAVILASALAEGRLTLRGARPCLDLFDLTDFAAAARGLDLHWGESEAYA